MMLWYVNIYAHVLVAFIVVVVAAVAAAVVVGWLNLEILFHDKNINRAFLHIFLNCARGQKKCKFYA